MRTVDLLRAVRDGSNVPDAALRQFVMGITQGTVPDYQATAFLMAVFMRGLPDASTTALTLAMRDSGRVLDLHDIPGIKVDKHSTGGVGDKISLPLAPLVAACGVPVPMISGRGLGHTGGTLDKLEAIPGFRTDLDVPTFRRIVTEVGACLIGQTSDIAPADKKLYALRDVTATVESIPLITASILAKKLSEGIDALVLDVKVGSGAFMRDLAEAQRLAMSLVRVGTQAGLKVRAVLTRMEAPLGRTIGNALEVRESIDILKNAGPSDTTALTLELAAHMLLLGGATVAIGEARALAQQSLASGAALQKFAQLIEAQGGDPRVIDDAHRLPTARHQTPVRCALAGIITQMDSFAMGMFAMRLGAGRAQAADRIDPAVGIELKHTVGDMIQAGDTWCVVHHNKPLQEPLEALHQALVVGTVAPRAAPLVIAVEDGAG
jgi:pyrimidine-nucleoside phosphorylase